MISRSCGSFKIFYYKLGDAMKKVYSQTLILVLIIVVLSLGINTGCVSVVEGRSGENEPTTVPAGVNFISTTEDIKNLVTDDKKLVINYYDAYIWTVFFDNDNTVKSMVYVYDFKSSEEAENNTELRKKELEKNKTMTITSAYNVENYVVMELEDTSFKGVSREILENNFKGLIVE